MANVGFHETKPRRCTLFLIALSYLLSHQIVSGKSISSPKGIELVKHKGTVKTIEAEDGGVIDCVDIYQQPAFDHPLLTNHTIEMKPSSIPSGLRQDFDDAEISTSWLTGAECPDGTIPIPRTQEDDFTPHSIAIPPETPDLNGSLAEQNPDHEYAQVTIRAPHNYGAQTSINVWNPAIYNEEATFSQIWVYAGDGENLNTMEAGWRVGKDKKTRFFIFWTRDGYESTGCFNLECPGFVQVNKRFILGSPISPVSKYNGNQYEIFVAIYKNQNSGHWWLQVQNQALGYWPDSIFTSLKDYGESINFGGEVFNTEAGDRHTSTQMGSGHFAAEGFKRAAYFRNIQYLDNNIFLDPGTLIPYTTNNKCYSLAIANDRKGVYRTHFYYGGPGYSTICRR